VTELAHLRTFLAVYRAGSLTRAATHLGLSQPAVTAHLRALEGEVAEPLFVRLHRGVAPTARGHALARELAPHLDAVDDIAQALASPSGVAGLVRLGGPPDLLALKVLPAVVPLLDHGLRIQASPRSTTALLDQLRRRHLDLAILPGREDGEDLVQTPLFTEELVLLGSPTWAQRIGPTAIARAGAQALAGIPLVAYTEELPIIRGYFAQVFAQPPSQRAALVVDDLRAVADAVAGGAGITVLPRYHLTARVVRGDLVVLHHPAQPPTNLVYLTHRREPLDPPAALVRAALHRAALDWGHD